MHPYTVRFGGGADETVLHPAVLVLMLLAMTLFFVLPRRKVIAPLLFATFLIPQRQQFYVAGIHLYVLRLLVLAATIRVLTIRRDKGTPLLAGGWMPIDTAVTCTFVIVATATLIQFMNGAALVNQIGYLWDYVLGYLLVRALIRDERDTALAIRCIAVLAMILACTMIIEQQAKVDIFGVLNGHAGIPEVRNGKIRSSGVFQHALTAGAFGATSIPLFAILWRNRERALGALGIVAATVMVMTTQTSTSMITYAAAILGLAMWPLRRKMKTIRFALVGGIAVLAMVMKAPVWFVIAHVDLTGSSSSYQRAALIDQFIGHFSKWWLMGTSDAANWGWDMWDAQNMYVSIGEAGGLAALISFVLILSRSFGQVGRARKRALDNRREWLLWCLGAALFSHVVAFFGVNYFDQSRVAWFLLLAMICACASMRLQRTASPARSQAHAVSGEICEEALASAR